MSWVEVSYTRGANPKRGSPYSQPQGPDYSMKVLILNTRGHTKESGSEYQSCGASSMRGSGHRQVHEPHRGVGVRI